MIYDTNKPAAMEKAWSMKIAPAMPLMNISGTNTATVVSMELSIGVITSVVPAAHALRKEYPCSRYCDIFSVTIMELSIIIPTASIKPDSEMIFNDTLKR